MKTSVVVLGLGPWPWHVLEDKFGLGLGLEGQVLVNKLTTMHFSLTVLCYRYKNWAWVPNTWQMKRFAISVV